MVAFIKMWIQQLLNLLYIKKRTLQLKRRNHLKSVVITVKSIFSQIIVSNIVAYTISKKLTQLCNFLIIMFYKKGPWIEK